MGDTVRNVLADLLAHAACRGVDGVARQQVAPGVRLAAARQHQAVEVGHIHTSLHTAGQEAQHARAIRAVDIQMLTLAPAGGGNAVRAFAVVEGDLTDPGGVEDGVQGGHTLLRSRRGDWVDVVPRKGSALFFRHGFGPASVLHEGRRVVGDVPKYVARINVMYTLR